MADYIAVAHSGTPYVSAYPWSAGFSTKYSDPAALPPNFGYAVAFTPSADAIAVGSLNTSPYVSAYPWSAGFGTKVSDPATLPGGNVMAVAFSGDGAYVTLGTNTSPKTMTYPWSAGFGTKVSDPASLPAGTVAGAAFTAASDYVSVAHGSSPGIATYPWSGSYGTKASDPGTTPGVSSGVAFAPSGSYIAVAASNSPRILVYPWSGSYGTKASNPGTLPTGGGEGITFSPAGNYVAIAHATSPFVSVYPWSGSFGTKVTNPGTLPAGTGREVSFNSGGNAIAISHSTTPFVSTYPWSPGFGSKYSNPSTLPNGDGYGVAFATGPTVTNLSAGSPAAVTFTGYAPTLKNVKYVAAGSPAAVAFTGHAPTLSNVTHSAAGSPASITFTGYAPTLQQIKRLAAGSPAAITWTGHAPTLTRIIRVAAGAPASVTWTGYAPTALNAKNLAAGTPGAVTWTGYAPTLRRIFTAGAPAAVTFTGHAPTALTRKAAGSPGTIAFAGYASTLSRITRLTPGVAAVAFTGHAPTLRRVFAAGAPASVAFTGNAPTSYIAKVLQPSSAAIAFTGHAPELVAIRGLRPRAGVRVELYARAWNGSAFVETKIGAGPIPVMTARYSEAEAEIGAFSFTMPADHPRAELLDPSDEIPGARYARIFVGGEGYVFLGEITNIKRTASADGRRVLVASGWSSARELTRLKTGFGFTLTDETMADAVDAILDGTGWTAGSIASAAIATYVLEANGASRFQALTRLAEIQGFMLRFNSTTRTVDMGPLGTNPEGIRFTAIEGPISPRFRSAVSKVIPIASAQIVSESEDVRNKVRIEGQIQGVDGDALTLAESSLDTPYVRQTETGPDGRTVYFIADATSIAANGVFEEDLVRRDIRLIGTDATERERAANSLYGAAVTFILEHKDRVKTFAMTPVGLRHLVEDVDIAPVAGKYPVWFRGWRDERDGRRVWVEIDQDLYLLRRERVIDSSGRSTWALGWSTTTRELSSDDQEVASTISDLKAATAARLPMVTWGGYPPIGRLTSVGMDIISGDNTFGGGITEPRQIRHVSSDFVTQHASRWAQIIDGDQRFLIDEIRGDADGMITRRAWNYPTNDDSQLTSDNLVMPDGLTFDAFKFIYYFTFKGTVVGAYKRISTSPEKWAWVSYRNGSLKEVGGNMKATNDGPYFLPAGPERGQYYANDYTTWRPLSELLSASAPTTTTNNTALTAVAMPATVDAGDLLLVFCASYTASNHATPSGWTQLAAQGISDGGGAGTSVGVFYKVAAGNEDGTTLNFSAGAKGTAHVYRIPAGTYTGTPVASTQANGSSSTPNPNAVSFTGRGLYFSVSGYQHATGGSGGTNATHTITSTGILQEGLTSSWSSGDSTGTNDPSPSGQPGGVGVQTWVAFNVAVRAADNAVDADTTITNLIVSPAATPDYIQIELAVGDPGSEVSIGEHKIVPGGENNFIPIDLSAGDRISARVSGGAAYLSVQLLDQADAA